jgi:hypothetical protein
MTDLESEKEKRMVQSVSEDNPSAMTINDLERSSGILIKPPVIISHFKARSTGYATD